MKTRTGKFMQKVRKFQRSGNESGNNHRSGSSLLKMAKIYTSTTIVGSFKLLCLPMANLVATPLQKSDIITLIIYLLCLNLHNYKSHRYVSLYCIIMKFVTIYDCFRAHTIQLEGAEGNSVGDSWSEGNSVGDSL